MSADTFRARCAPLAARLSRWASDGEVIRPASSLPDAFLITELSDGTLAKLNITGNPVFTGTDDASGMRYGLLRLGAVAGGRGNLCVTADYRDRLIGQLYRMGDQMDPLPAELAGGAAS
jgi:hypothetical protein